MPETTEKVVKQKGPFYRYLGSLAITRGKKEDQDTLTFSASSEEPAERWYGMEVLSHDKEAVRLTRAKAGAMPLLFNHNIDDPIGMITGARIEQSRLMVDANLFNSDRASQVKAMIDGGLRNVSLAYRVNVIEENKKTDMWTVTDWEPFEVSIVTVPMDHTVGIGRNESEYDVRMITHSQKERAMPEEKSTVAVVEPPKENTEKIEELKSKNGVEVEASRTRAIMNFAKSNRVADSVRDAWIEQGYSLEQVSVDLLSILEERGKTNPQPASRLGLSSRDTERFSIMRAIKACAGKSWQKDAPYELEISKAVAQRLGKVADENHFFVPFEVLQRPFDIQAIEQLRQQLGLTKRDLTVATASAAGYLVETGNEGFIEMLRNRSVAFTMGVRRLSGLVGNVTIPRQSAAATAYWLPTEATQITESQQTFVQIAMTPKTVGAYTEISRQLLLQSNPSAEGIVTDDLAKVCAIAADLAVLNGSGAGGQPLGIIGTSGIGGVTGTTIAYGGIVEFQTDVAASNVRPMAGGYVMTPTVAGLLMGRQRFSGTDTPLWVGNVWDGTMSGFKAMSSNQMPAATILFGDWSEIIVAEWGVLEVEVNPYANFQAGIIGVRCMYSMDVGVRRPFAFSLATSVT